MMGKKSSDGKEIRNLPCPNSNCNSSDALVRYLHDDSAYCFSCGKSWNNYSKLAPGDNVMTFTKPVMQSSKFEEVSGPLPSRGLTQETLDKFGVKLLIKEDEVVGVKFPYHTFEGKEIASKYNLFKTDSNKKQYWSEGPLDQAVMFGLPKFNSGCKILTLTEGELDCISVYQMMGPLTNVVSLKNGAQSVEACLRDSKVYDWINSFNEIKICFDNDEQGLLATNKIIEMFSPEKVKVVKLKDYKDANEYLMAGKEQEFKSLWWKAMPMIMEGIKNGSDLAEYVFNPSEVESVEWPYKALTSMTLGIRMGEMTTLTAAPGGGKTLLMCELVNYLIEKTPHNIGCLFLENSEAKTALDLVGVAMSYPLKFAMQNKTSFEEHKFNYDAEFGTGKFEENRKVAFDKSLGSKRLWTIGDKDFAMNNIDRVISRVRYMAKVLNCKYIFLDHISIIVSSQEAGGDERKALDEIATKLRMLVHDLNIHLFMVSHLRRTAGKSHEEGGKTSLSDLRGTAGIGQLSDTVLGLERDGQNEDERKRNTSLIRVLKCRFTGQTGPSSYVYYDKKTNRLSEVEPEACGSSEQEEDTPPVFDLSDFSNVR